MVHRTSKNSVRSQHRSVKCGTSSPEAVQQRVASELPVPIQCIQIAPAEFELIARNVSSQRFLFLQYHKQEMHLTNNPTERQKSRAPVLTLADRHDRPMRDYSRQGVNTHSSTSDPVHALEERMRRLAVRRDQPGSHSAPQRGRNNRDRSRSPRRERSLGKDGRDVLIAHGDGGEEGPHRAWLTNRQAARYGW